MAYKTFANGFPLPASDLNNFLMNQSVIVFADSAARGTAIPSPVEGMLTYLEDTNAYESWNGSAYVALVEDPDLTALVPKSTVTTAQDLIVADGASSVTRLGVGTDDQVLSVVAGAVAWADAGGGGGGLDWDLVSSGSFPSASSITFSGLTAYDNYLIIYNDVGNTSASSNLALDSINSDSTAFGVSFEFTEGEPQGPKNSDLGRLSSSNSAAFDTNGLIEINGCRSTNPALVKIHSGYQFMSNSGRSSFSTKAVWTKDSLALSSLVISWSSGNFDNGTYKIYGA